jgi:hypothetical protein
MKLVNNKPAYQWQGTPCEVKFGYVIQEENIENPLYWYNFECCTKQNMDGGFVPDHNVSSSGKHLAVIPALQVSQGGQTFMIANHHGIGVSKLEKGGWPNHTHFSLRGTFHENSTSFYAIKELDLEAFQNHESERNKWLKANYPKEYERLENLRNSIRDKSWLKK